VRAFHLARDVCGTAALFGTVVSAVIDGVAVVCWRW
jgi:hypothetical protein